MPKRQNIYTILSDEVQGSGSFVKVRAIRYGEARQMAPVLTSEDPEVSGPALIEMLIKHVVEWNWVDDVGDALPLPTSGDIIDDLTAQEIKFLAGALSGETDSKNSSGNLKPGTLPTVP